MAQVTTQTVANGSGASVRSNMNLMFGALFSSSSGATAPTTTVAGQLWFDTGSTPAVMKRRNSANDGWDKVSPGETITDRTSGYTAVEADRHTAQRCTTTLTLGFEAAATLGSDWSTVVFADGGNVTLDPDGSETINGSSTASLQDGEWGIVYSDGSNLFLLAVSTRAVQGTEQLTTSGTAFDWTGLPAGINELTLHLDAVSLSGTDAFLVQLGTSGGFVTSGYVANAATIFGSSAGESLSTSGVPITNISAGEALNGHLTFKRMDGDKWTASGSFGNSTGSYFSSGKVDLGAELTQIRLTRSGSNTFDAGAANASWRF